MSVALVFAVIQPAAAQIQGQPPSASKEATPASDVSQAGTRAEALFQLASPRTGRQRQNTRSSRGQSLTFTGNLQGGYDDNVGATLGGSVPAAAPSGSSGLVDAMLEYSRRSSARSITFRTLGSFQMYPDYLDGPAAAGKFRVSGHTQMCQKNTLRYSAQVRYEPLFTPGLINVEDLAIGRDASDMTLPVTSGGLPAIGLFERPSLVSSNKAYLEREWNRRNMTVFSYLYYAQHTMAGGVENNIYQQAAGEYRRRIRRATTLQASYLYSTGTQTDSSGISRPNSQHTLTGGPAFAKVLPGRRQLLVSVGTGATYVAKVNTTTGDPLEGWMPAARASAHIDLTRTISLNAEYGRSYTMLQGLTGELYSTDQVGVSTGVRLTSRAELALGGTRTNGQIALASGGGNAFDLYGATLNVRVALTSALAATMGYFYYEQQFSNRATLPVGFPPRYQRHAFLVGLQFWAPLAGTLPANPRAPGEW